MLAMEKETRSITMKIRKGFVSNSSASSFCAYGIRVDGDFDYLKYAKAMKKHFPEEFKKAFSDINPDNPMVKEAILNINDGSYFEDKKRPGCEHEVNRDKVKFCPECGVQSWIEEPLVDEDDVEDWIKDAAYDMGGLSTGGYEGIEYVGLCYEDAPDDQTFGEFRARAKKILQEIFGDNIEVKHIEEAWGG